MQFYFFYYYGMIEESSNHIHLSAPKGAQGAIVSLMVAVGENNVIGRNNQLPWHLPADLKFFKNTTWGFPIVMGRKTFESIGKSLPGRTNIVLTKNTAWGFENVSVVHSIADAVAIAQGLNVKEIFVIGGAEVFKTVLPLASRIYRTRIHHSFEGDVFFPEISEAEWNLVKSHRHEPDEKNNFAYTFQTWERT